jgi:hypothetical protein
MIAPISALSLLLTLSAAPHATPLDAVSADRLRIRAQLAQVEADLRARDVSGLSPSARAARARALDTLHGYWQAGRFPHNEGPSSERVPIFIDAEGRTCAVAELMRSSGATRLAQTVAAHENRARVLEMRTELGPWLAENGLSAEEAARIQPNYCFCSNVSKPVCGTIAAGGATQELTFLNQCVAERCYAGAQLLHDGECTTPGAALASEAALGYCTCGDGDGSDTRAACDCRVPSGTRQRAPQLGLGLLLGALLALLARWSRRR